MEKMEFLGVDLGVKRTGIARGSSLAKIAQPLPSLPTDKLLDSLSGLIKANGAQAIVVGLPRNLQSEDSAQTAWVRQWVAAAKNKVGLPFYWQDEALTTVQARGKPSDGLDRFDKLTASELTAGKLRAGKQKATSNTDEHSLAAAAILQDFLDGSNEERVLA
ncbi:Holliday junction resolvase RuvX [Candidatus Saccharibacteria bacterium]|nr:Holliday junction resolvase RuvX [Candidatus Saccharibacteria bacterium]